MSSPANDSIVVVPFPFGAAGGSDIASLEDLAGRLEALREDVSVRGIVISLNGTAPSGRAGIFANAALPAVSVGARQDLLEAVEKSTKPIVAAIHKAAVGVDLELALACRARLATSAALIGFPDITVGLVPGLGGVGRLTRLVGAEVSLGMLVSGSVSRASDFVAAGLVDDIVDGEIDSAASALAVKLAEQPSAVRAGNVEESGLVPAVEARRSRLQSRQKLQPAYEATLQAVIACASTPDGAHQVTSQLFARLQASVQARALAYQAQAEVLATRPPDELQTPPLEIHRIAVIGAGTMGTGIAMAAIDSGFSVMLLEQDAAALERGRQRVVDYYQERVASGKLAAELATARIEQLTVTLDWSVLQQVDMVIEAVFEELGVKQAVFRQIDAHARQGAVLATNTSYLDIDAIAAATARPQDVIGLHFFSPAHVMKLLEVVRGALTSPETLATGMWLGVQLKKTPVLCGNAFGFIGNRIYNAYRRQCELMLEDGAWPEDVDNALTAIGFAMGPFAVADLSGLDIAWRMRKSQAAARDPEERYVDILDRLCEAGRLGRKTGAGYYTYEDGKQIRTTDQTVRDVIADASERRGISRRTLAPLDIQNRALFAMVNEAALLLEEGVASRPSDVDVVMAQGYGFPRWLGGPVFWASQRSAAELKEGLQRLAGDVGPGFVAGDMDFLNIAAL